MYHLKSKCPGIRILQSIFYSILSVLFRVSNFGRKQRATLFWNVLNQRLLIVFSLLPVILFVNCYRDEVRKGTISLQLGDYSTAIEIFSSLVKQYPERFETHLGLGKSLLQRSADLNDSSDWKNGLIQIEASLSLHPDDSIRLLLSDAWFLRARGLLAGKDTTSGLDAIARSLEYNPGAIDPLNLAGILYYKQGDYQKAEVLFKNAVMIDSTRAAPHFNLGIIYWSNNKIQDAHKQWLIALKLSPDDPDILYWFSYAEKKLRE
jgi:tetratricopeptide (TPR) repeat protein